MSNTLKLPTAQWRRASEDSNFKYALLAEFAGVALFQVLAGSIGDRPLETGLAFAAIMYAVKYVSGGHLNPAVSLAAAGSGHIEGVRAFSYIAAQVVGAIVGCLLQVYLVPGVHLGHETVSCLAPTRHTTWNRLWGWEALMTYIFIMVMYSAIFVRPGHGDMGPLAAGITIYVAAAAAGTFTGNSPVNPAIALANSLVFKCFWNWYWFYLLAHITAAGLAILTALAFYGKGPWFGSGSPTDQLREELLSSEPNA